MKKIFLFSLVTVILFFNTLSVAFTQFFPPPTTITIDAPTPIPTSTPMFTPPPIATPMPTATPCLTCGNASCAGETNKNVCITLDCGSGKKCKWNQTGTPYQCTCP